MLLPSQEMLEESNSHDQEDSRKEDDVFTSLNTSMVNTSIALLLGPTLATIDANESKKVGDELQGVELPLDIWNPYSFVGLIEKRSIE